MNKPVKLLISTVFCLLILHLLNACGSDAPVKQSPPTKPIQLRVSNDSQRIVDSIDAKPCGSDSGQYRTQMTSIKPGQKIMLELYMHCADLVALDGFGSVLDELKYLRLNSNISWKIR